MGESSEIGPLLQALARVASSARPRRTRSPGVHSRPGAVHCCVPIKANRNGARPDGTSRPRQACAEQPGSAELSQQAHDADFDDPQCAVAAPADAMQRHAKPQPIARLRLVEWRAEGEQRDTAVVADDTSAAA